MAKRTAKTEAPVVVQYATIFELKKYYGSLRLPIKTPNDIKAISEKQNFFDEVHKDFYQKVQAVEIPEESTPEQENEIRDKAANELLSQDSGVKKADLAFFKPEALVEAIKDLKLTNNEVFFLNYWLVG